ncbi:hypothetical protein [Falsiruegeria mediterranea]|jgi:uncharacterized Fe-S cluster protein YjdI|uniref:Uncharacterized protein n=1 Tax=Falsiruegeria mediterranea M17 TaxID=1200281 RepID=A0A2R8C5M5_9RHOB|nr:hypothetical protein [Falsiruegeria mediterranea]SPJ27735.1 hypothetical protein TRM7615_01226 [Falsiruegeria mediterranea M17]
MADIVVFDRSKIGDVAQRQFGMKKLGEVFNEHFMDPSLTPDEVVNKTIQYIINNCDDCDVTYKGDANVMSIENENAGIYQYQAGPPAKKVKLNGVKDNDQAALEQMNIAISEGNNDLLEPNNYLSTVITDLGATDSEDRRKYLLGTITYRRCR